jgi:putative Mn2+ efflux pump MntP
MNVAELILLAVGLSLDAFAAAVCKGLCMRSFSLKKAAIVGLYFGGFQALMPALGYLLGVQFRGPMMRIDHWIAFILLGLIGVRMILESRKTKCRDVEADCREQGDSLRFPGMLLLAFATSVDALAAGVTFAFLNVRILSAAAVIGTITFTLSAAGVRIGHVFGARFERSAELAGGVILVGLGFKILLEHLGLLYF